MSETNHFVGIVPTDISRQVIIRLSQRQPILDQCLGFWHMGLCTYEEALQLCVAIMSSQIDELYGNPTGLGYAFTRRPVAPEKESEMYYREQEEDS